MADETGVVDSGTGARTRVAEIRALAEARARGEDVLPGAHTGIPYLDEAVGGYPKGLLTVIGMASKGGKSSWILNGVEAGLEARPGLIPYIDSLEDPYSMWWDRMLARRAGVNSELLEKGQVSPAELARLDRAAEKPVRWEINAQTGRTVTDLIEGWRGEKWVNRHKYSVWWVDYAQRVEGRTDREKDDPNLRISNVVTKLADFAAKSGLPVVLISQFKNEQMERGLRRYEKKADYQGYIPQLSDLYGTVALRQVAKLVILLHRPGQWDKSIPDNKMVAYIAARNRGKEGIVNLEWDPTTARIWWGGARG